MKKFLTALVIATCLFTFTPSAEAFGWQDVTNFFQRIFSREIVVKTEAVQPPIETTETSMTDEEILAEIMKQLEKNQPDLNDLVRKDELILDDFIAPKSIVEPTAPIEPVIAQEVVPVVTPATDFEEIIMNFTCKTIVKTFEPTGRYYFASLPYGSQKRHTEILRYKIKWFDGSWSGWFVPGRNDEDWKGNRHFWANFADHQYQVEHCGNYQYSPPA